MSFISIDNEEDLSYLNQELLNKPYLGVDTEFRRTSKDDMKLALLQVNDGEEIYLIDSIAIKEPKDNCDFLFSGSVTKILHSCKEDIEAIYSWTGKAMVNIFDTQIANALLHGDYSIGYQQLVKDYLDLDLEKNETRSNWIKRPLTNSQLKYAALDVEYLIYLYLDQKIDLDKTSKIGWLSQDIEKLTNSIFNPMPIFNDLERTVSKSQEMEYLKDFNLIVEKISRRKRLIQRYFFQKKHKKTS